MDLVDEIAYRIFPWASKWRTASNLYCFLWMGKMRKPEMKPHFTGPIYLLLIELYTDIYFLAFKAPRFQIFSLRGLAFHGMATEGPRKLVDYPLRLLGTQGRWGQSKWWSYQLPTLSPTKSLNQREKVFWQHSFSSFFFQKNWKKTQFLLFWHLRKVHDRRISSEVWHSIFGVGKPRDRYNCWAGAVHGCPHRAVFV